MSLIDTHCHLAQDLRRGTIAPVLERAAAAGVERMITIGTSMEDWMLYRNLSAAHPGRIDYMVGLHPSDVGLDWEEQVRQLSTYFIPPHPPVGLGEIGMDHFRLPADPIEAAKVIQLQEDAFRAQLDLGLQLDCPLVVHSRGAFAECMRVIDESGVDWSRVVFHCFVDGPVALQSLRDRGGRASFTGILTFPQASEIREAAKGQGLGVLMLETDSPYLAPVPVRGTRNEPANVRHLAEYCSSLFGISFDELARQTSENARHFFNLDQTLP